MNRATIVWGKAITLLLWATLGASLLGLIGAPISTLIFAFSALVFGVHVLEVIYLMSRHRDRVRSPLSDMVQVLVFGVFSLGPIISPRTGERQ